MGFRINNNFDNAINNYASNNLVGASLIFGCFDLRAKILYTVSLALDQYKFENVRTKSNRCNKDKLHELWHLYHLDTHTWLQRRQTYYNLFHIYVTISM